MRRIFKGVACLMAALMLFCTVATADSIFEDKDYLSLGADLKSNEKAEVLRLLDVDDDDMDEYEIITVTNQEEHKYLENYVDSSVIGSRALSSVLIEKEDSGSGIEVETYNIDYCTPGMYQNALATAGVTDADIKVAGPFPISGTAALVGIMKAYETMTGESISEENKDAATNELVVTGSIAEKIKDSNKAEELIAYVKTQIGNRDLSSKEDISAFIDECGKKFEISLSEEDKELILKLIEKFDNIDLNIDQIKEQVGHIYDKLKNMDIDIGGALEKTNGWLEKIFIKVSDFFSNLFK